MKKVFAIVLATVMVISCSMTAFADVLVDGKSKGTEKVSVKSAEYVYVFNPGELEITGNVTGSDSDGSSSVYASGTKVTVGGGVTDSHSGHAINATTGAEVTVEKYVTEKGDGNAIDASIGATVKAGSVDEKDDGFAINANGTGTTVTVNGNVTESGDGSGLQAVEATIIVIGNVEEKNAGSAITALKNATVIVGGNVTDGVETAGASYAVSSGYDATVIVEGLVTGQLSTNGQTNSGTIYLGKLNGGIEDNADLSKIHYLIGAADGQNNKINVTGDFVGGTIDGAKNNGYYYTTTGNSEILKDKTFIIKSAVSDKKIKIEGTYDNVTITPNDDGTYTLTIGEKFKGGIQALNVIFEDIARQINSSGGSTKTIYTGTWNIPVTNGKWTQKADGTWSYSTAYKFTNTWGCIANPNDANSVGWYYFDRNGKMLTGWQLLTWNGTKKWYYFSQTKDANEGKCQLGGITPDGYVLNPDGSWKEN